MKTLALLLLFLATLGFSERADAGNSNGDYVVLLHGIIRSSSHMKDLEGYLEKKDYDVINLDYPSTDHTLESLTELIQKDLSRAILEEKRVHFVGYSMGGLLVRAIIHQKRPENLGRVVQLAPPNKGSEIADFLKGNWLYKEIYGPAGQQLTTKSNLTTLFGKIDYDLGIIAGNRSIDPLSSAIIPGPDDGKVSIKSTRLKGMIDHIVVAATHTFFPQNKIVHHQTAYFLKHGEFRGSLGE